MSRLGLSFERTGRSKNAGGSPASTQAGSKTRRYTGKVHTGKDVAGGGRATPEGGRVARPYTRGYETEVTSRRRRAAVSGVMGVK